LCWPRADPTNASRPSRCSAAGANEESLEVGLRAERVARACGSAPVQAQALLAQAAALGELGRFDEAIAAYDRALPLIAERYGVRRTEQWARLVLGRALCSMGEDEQATATIDRAFEATSAA
jgi:tetratricopeptide (TPR) repeat protein